MAGKILSPTKACTKCGLEKLRSEFFPRPRRKPGQVTSRCRKCIYQCKKEYAATEKGRAQRAEYQKKWRGLNVSHASRYQKVYQLRKRYGLSVDQYIAMIERQRGECALCGAKPDSLNIDHCHETGRVRGLLCNPCNMGIGQLGDTVEALERALSYLKNAQSTESRDLLRKLD